MTAKKALLWGLVLSVIALIGVVIVSNAVSGTKLATDQGAAWYYWKLTDPTVFSRLSVWSLYILHQLGFWYLIYLAQKEKTKYSNTLQKINIWAIAFNVVFVLLHLLQTYFFYDGLAQDVSIFSSQGSVILMLVWIILMSSKERGLLLGKGKGLKSSVIEFAKKYHGYIFAWATVYTFWYHPAVSTPGHLIGFFYMFMLFIQGSLFFTTIHVNKYWRVILELFVLVHGTTVAIYQGGNLWPMFLFGFWGAFLLIYMWGLGWSKRAKIINTVIYLIAWIIIWGQIGYAQSFRTIFIPLIYYICVFVLFALIWLIQMVYELARRIFSNH